jgi:tRNA (guanine-N7-)-methyltransferase
MRCAASLVSVPQRKFLSSFGRNRGRSLRPYQQGLVDELLPTLLVDISSLRGAAGDVAPERSERGDHREPIPSSLSAEDSAHWIASALPRNDGYKKLALEIGFGGGEHLLAQAEHNPDTLFIGCEPYINGVAKCLAGIDEQKISNIRLYTRDARELIEALPDACLDSVFILFPDPWPKLRHNKRRLVSAQTLSMLARTHKKGGAIAHRNRPCRLFGLDARGAAEPPRLFMDGQGTSRLEKSAQRLDDDEIPAQNHRAGQGAAVF